MYSVVKIREKVRIPAKLLGGKLENSVLEIVQEGYEGLVDDDVGLVMGGVFLYRYTGEDLQGLSQHLKGKQLSGIGLRREEGFGRISICNPAHTIKEVM